MASKSQPKTRKPTVARVYQTLEMPDISGGLDLRRTPTLLDAKRAGGVDVADDELVFSQERVRELDTCVPREAARLQHPKGMADSFSGPAPRTGSSTSTSPRSR